MVELDFRKDNLVSEEDEARISSLREERQRTGRYIAVGTAIFLSLLGSYQAVVSGTPQYAALFAPALIMFIYILWILNASANQRKALLAAAAASSKTDCDSVIEMELPQHHVSTPKNNANAKVNTSKNDKMADNNMASNAADKNSSSGTAQPIMYSRSYSIA